MTNNKNSGIVPPLSAPDPGGRAFFRLPFSLAMMIAAAFGLLLVVAILAVGENVRLKHDLDEIARTIPSLSAPVDCPDPWADRDVIDEPPGR